MNRLQRLVTNPRRRVIGLMSGTSVDGVDAALVDIAGSGWSSDLAFQHFLSFPYPNGLKEHILECSTAGQGSIDALCRLNVLLGEIFAEAALALVREAGLEPSQVDVIGSHGQTVHHLPEPLDHFGYPVRATLQLGEPAVIARRTGVVTVADFRPADMAAGGQGAPLVPYFDYVAFRSSEQSRALLNIGGIANFTVLKQNATLDDVVAFDTGPGNMLIDALMHKLFKKPFDKNGAVAGRGQVSGELLDLAMKHPFIDKKPPKSTGREAFGEAFCEQFMENGNRLGLNPEDLVATATAFTAEAIRRNYERFVQSWCPITELIVSGGGAHNPSLMRALRERFHGASLATIDDYGIPADAKEAVCFALLANETIAGNANNVPSATGAQQPAILGKICL